MAGISRLGSFARFTLHRVSIGSIATRSYGCAAAQSQYDSDEEYYADEEEDLKNRRMEPEPIGVPERFGRGLQWVVIGEPGAQKHLFAERLAKLLDVPHISMGSLVRQELNPRSSLYKQIENALNERKLVPEDVVFALLSRRLEEGYYRGESGFILDGIPRNKMQAEILDQVAEIDLVLNFKCAQNEMVKQHLGKIGGGSARGFHSSSHSGFFGNLSLLDSAQQLTVAGLKSLCNENPCLYEDQSKPLEDYYRKQKKLLDFKVAGPPGDTWQHLMNTLHLQDVDADRSTQELTA